MTLCQRHKAPGCSVVKCNSPSIAFSAFRTNVRQLGFGHRWQFHGASSENTVRRFMCSGERLASYTARIFVASRVLLFWSLGTL